MNVMDREVTNPTRGHESVLLVEDDDAVRDLTSLILGRAGYQVYEAGSIAEARQIWSDQSDIGILVTDVVMPEGTGDRLAADLTASRAALRVLFVTGLGEDSAPTSAPVVHKPFRPQALLDAVRALGAASH